MRVDRDGDILSGAYTFVCRASTLPTKLAHFPLFSNWCRRKWRIGQQAPAKKTAWANAAACKCRCSGMWWPMQRAASGQVARRDVGRGILPLWLSLWRTRHRGCCLACVDAWPVGSWPGERPWIVSWSKERRGAGCPLDSLLPSRGVSSASPSSLPGAGVGGELLYQGMCLTGRSRQRNCRARPSPMCHASCWAWPTSGTGCVLLRSARRGPARCGSRSCR